MDGQLLGSPTARTTGEGQRRTARATADVSLRRAALVAGLGMLVMAVLAFISVSALGNLVVSGDAAKTARNIVDNELLFRTAICGFLIVAILDVVVAWALYVFLGPAGRSTALLAAWFRVAYAIVFAAALGNLFVAVRLLSDAASLGAFGTGRLDVQAMMSVDAFNDGWHAALAIFGIHLLVLGYLAFRSGYVPRVVGILVMIASLGYLIDGFGTILSAGYNPNVARFTFVGEVLLMGWLLWKGTWAKSEPLEYERE